MLNKDGMIVWNSITDLKWVLISRIIGSGIRIKLGIWRVNMGDRNLASSLVAGDPGELGELTLFATLTQTQTQAFGEFGLKLYTDTQHKCSRCSCKFKRNVFFGCESSPISRNVRSSVSQSVSQCVSALDKCKVRPSKAQ